MKIVKIRNMFFFFFSSSALKQYRGPKCSLVQHIDFSNSDLIIKYVIPGGFYRNRMNMNQL